MICRNEKLSQYRYTLNEYEQLKDIIINYIRDNGPVTSKEIKNDVNISGLKNTQIQSLITHVGNLPEIQKFDKPYKYKVRRKINGRFK